MIFDPKLYPVIENAVLEAIPAAEWSPGTRVIETDGCMIVRQSAESHARIEKLLAEMRRPRRRQAVIEIAVFLPASAKQAPRIFRWLKDVACLTPEEKFTGANDWAALSPAQVADFRRIARESNLAQETSRKETLPDGATSSVEGDDKRQLELPFVGKPGEKLHWALTTGSEERGPHPASQADAETGNGPMKIMMTLVGGLSAAFRVAISAGDGGVVVSGKFRLAKLIGSGPDFCESRNVGHGPFGIPKGSYVLLCLPTRFLSAGEASVGNPVAMDAVVSTVAKASHPDPSYCFFLFHAEVLPPASPSEEAKVLFLESPRWPP